MRTRLKLGPGRDAVSFLTCFEGEAEIKKAGDSIPGL
jgi:hypothetical protein